MIYSTVQFRINFTSVRVKMQAINVFVLLVMAVAVSARGIPKKYSQLSPYLRQTTYADILQSENLIDFHLTDSEKKSLTKYFQEIAGLTTEEISAVAKLKNIKDAALKSIASIKLTEGQKLVLADNKFSAFVLALNYDLVAQILDPDYEKNIFTIPLMSGHKYTDGQQAALDVLSKRWATGITGQGVIVPEGSLANFYQGTEEEVQKRKDDVYQIYTLLDRFVVDTLDQANSKYGLYPQIVIDTIAATPVPSTDASMSTEAPSE